MATFTIKITGGDTKKGRLTFDPPDPDRTVKPNDAVEWHVQEGCGVKNIHDVSSKSTSPMADAEIWGILPHKVDDHVWSGTIKSTASSGEWHYNLRWKAHTIGTIHNHDPKIIVNTTVG